MNLLFLIPIILLGVFFILKEILGDNSKSQKQKSFQKLLYKKGKIMTEAEISFFRALEAKYSSQYYILPQVSLSSILEVDLPRNFFAYKGYYSKIDKKRIDFILFDKKNFNPMLAFELDDSSHLKPEAEENDTFKNNVLAKTGIKLIRIKTASHYDLDKNYE